jgi:hypothetical protein
MVIKYIDEALANAFLDPLNLSDSRSQITLTCSRLSELADFRCDYSLDTLDVGIQENSEKNDDPLVSVVELTTE